MDHIRVCPDVYSVKGNLTGPKVDRCQPNLRRFYMQGSILLPRQLCPTSQKSSLEFGILGIAGGPHRTVAASKANKVAPSPSLLHLLPGEEEAHPGFTP